MFFISLPQSRCNRLDGDKEREGGIVGVFTNVVVVSVLVLASFVYFVSLKERWQGTGAGRPRWSAAADQPLWQ